MYQNPPINALYVGNLPRGARAGNAAALIMESLGDRLRVRRRYDEIERLYQCSWPDCNKVYGTLNNLNSHVQMQKHGAKRSPNGNQRPWLLFGEF
jgi:hypothetical protein